MNFAERIYRRLAQAFPHEFKMAFGDEMLQAGEEAMRQIAKRHGVAGLLRLSAGVLPLARAAARFAPVSVGDVAEAFLRALATHKSHGATYELCGPEVMTLAELVRLTARVAQLPCHIVPLPDLLARLQGVVLGLLPGKPFSLDNFRSLTVDSVCRENGLAALGIKPEPLLAVLPGYLGPQPVHALS